MGPINSDHGWFEMTSAQETGVEENKFNGSCSPLLLF
jgi:hypothetical protein